jgi:general secretion pathway protein J
VRRLRDAAGLTLVEVLIAVTILAVIVVLMTSALRVGTRAWEAGERRAAAQQELRAVVELVTDALSAAAPYQGRLGEGLDRRVLFVGEADEVRFVTTTPPMLLDVPVAPFHAVTLRHAADEGELRLAERLVPTDEPFGEDPHVVLSRAVTGLRFEYRDDEGLWQDRWDPTRNALPVTIRVELKVRDPGRGERTAVFLVPVLLAKVAS